MNYDDPIFDYDRQAWTAIANGARVYLRCGHPDEMVCGCYGRDHAGQSVKSILELIIELERLDDERTIERFKLTIDRNPSALRIDFDHWLRRGCDPRRPFASLDDAWLAYETSFGVSS